MFLMFVVQFGLVWSKRQNIVHMYMIIPMHNNAQFRVKFNNTMRDEFSCRTGVHHAYLPFNDTEQEFITKGADGVDIGLLKLFLLLYADDKFILSPLLVYQKKSRYIKLLLYNFGINYKSYQVKNRHFQKRRKITTKQMVYILWNCNRNCE